MSKQRHAIRFVERAAHTYFFTLICRKWWKTLMTSRIRRGASSILEARLMQAIATIWKRSKTLEEQHPNKPVWHLLTFYTGCLKMDHKVVNVSRQTVLKHVYIRQQLL